MHAGDYRASTRTHDRHVETKPSFKTTELIVYVLGVIGLLLASYLVADVPGGRADYFLANEAWKYITWLTVAYLISRGLAKSGSRHPDTDELR